MPKLVKMWIVVIVSLGVVVAAVGARVVGLINSDYGGTETLAYSNKEMPTPTAPTSSCYPAGPALWDTNPLQHGSHQVNARQQFRLVNGTDHYREFTMRCSMVNMPKVPAGQPVGLQEAKAMMFVAPRTTTVHEGVMFRWTTAWKTKEPEKFLYRCSCTSKEVRRPVYSFEMPFIPYN